MVRRREGSRQKGSRRRILEMVVLFVIGSIILVKLLEVGSQMAVPYDYDEYIEKYSKAYQVDKALVAAVIYQESRYRPDAESRVGALGLMQVMPDTGAWIAGKLKEDFSKVMLKDPETSIRYGTWYLSYLLERYDGNLRSALAAYNAGPGSVDRWLQSDRYAKDGELTEIPFKETREYVAVVLSMRETYRRTYARNFLEVTE